MAEEGILMISPRELKKLFVIRKVLDKEITPLKASEILSLSSRQITRIVKRVRDEGDQGVIHKSRGRASNRLLNKSPYWKRLKSGRKWRQQRGRYHKRELEHLQWLLQAIKTPENVNWTEEMKVRSRDANELLRKAATGSQKLWKRALWLLGRINGASLLTLSRCFGVSEATIRRDWKKFKKSGIEGVFKKHQRCASKMNDEKIKATIFSIIHSPPSAHDINRTSWKLEDVCRCLSEQNIHVSKDLVSKIVKGAGYRWRKAKTVLTSTDPEYREKLDRIKSILSTLGENARFCSIDEFGPFAIKVKGGKKLVSAHEYPQVPQFQKSKGCLIVTAALELSQNQVTHFYSKAKNTTEMIKLLELLRDKYRGCDRLYFSWDAASWHASKALNEKVKMINLPEYQEKTLIPIVELVPLPKSAQFLNVIESVFSGMARAIIHNSNYHSVEEAITAIDRYFQERNEHFRNHPQKAGKKIWGKEPTFSEFSESNNCKDPRWR